MSGNTQKKKERLVFELEPDEFQFFETLLGLTSIKKKIDLFNDALSLFRWAVKEAAKGRYIGSIDDEHKRVERFTTPGLDRVREKAERAGLTDEARTKEILKIAQQ
ncbi:MAG: hypothetical protein ACOH5I_26040 [Oligoflexus sp.]